MREHNELWTDRKNEYWTMAIRYLRLIGNSGFLFAIYLLIVFGSYYYGQFIEWLPETFPTAILLTVVFSLMITRGRVRTFMKQADLVFLLPMEARLKEYFKKSLVYSLVMETFWLSLVFFLFLPLYVDRIGTGGDIIFGTLALFALLKLWNLLTSFEEQRMLERAGLHVGVRFVLNVMVVYAIITVQSLWVILAFAVILTLIYILYFKKLSIYQLKWERLIFIEENTVRSFYRVANNFTDVPALKEKVKPRAWANPIIQLVSYKNENVYRYLFARAFFRANDYLGFYVRLTLLGLLFIWAVDLPWGMVLVAALFAFMTAMQIETLKNHYRTHTIVSLYPIDQETRINGHRYWLLFLGSFQTLLFAVFGLLFMDVVTATLILVAVAAVYGYHSQLRLPRVYKKERK
ncbi:ABC transporter permease [Paenalkalicoccus suaedae]|uniref:ABC transporter permease n=1 Tax=Paenalkalicoccus suaedae TaxID=2592382 RepID=A0A859FDC7_9BACI|nr:ABC transporter permease [Paenalkalicoccus suaedae]QKS70752.1 ABC transporter permease [Paenalkalicoccus suaedae]